MKKEGKMKPRIKIKIRHGKLSDVNEIYKLGERISELGFSKKYKFHEKSELKEFIRKPKENIVLVALINKEIVGFIYARILAHGSGGWCMLDNLAVSKKYRKHGIGTELLEELYKILKKRKIHYIQILEDIHKKHTRKFWKDKKFKESHVFIWAEKEI